MEISNIEDTPEAMLEAIVELQHRCDAVMVQRSNSQAEH